MDMDAPIFHRIFRCTKYQPCRRGLRPHKLDNEARLAFCWRSPTLPTSQDAWYIAGNSDVVPLKREYITSFLCSIPGRNISPVQRAGRAGVTLMAYNCQKCFGVGIGMERSLAFKKDE